MAIIADLATFRVLFPEFDPVDDAEIEVYLDLSNDELSDIYWGVCYDRAVLYLAAHQLALSQNRRSDTTTDDLGFVETSTGAGAITQASAGGISAGYSASISDTAGNDRDSWLGKTEYGQMYLALKRTCLPIGLIAGCSDYDSSSSA